MDKVVIVTGGAGGIGSAIFLGGQPCRCIIGEKPMSLHLPGQRNSLRLSGPQESGVPPRLCLDLVGSSQLLHMYPGWLLALPERVLLSHLPVHSFGDRDLTRPSQ